MQHTHSVGLTTPFLSTQEDLTIRTIDKVAPGSSLDVKTRLDLALDTSIATNSHHYIISRLEKALLRVLARYLSVGQQVLYFFVVNLEHAHFQLEPVIATKIMVSGNIEKEGIGFTKKYLRKTHSTTSGFAAALTKMVCNARRLMPGLSGGPVFCTVLFSQQSTTKSIKTTFLHKSVNIL